MNWDVVRVQVCGACCLSVDFADGLHGRVTFLTSAFRGVFAHLQDAMEFQKVRVVDGVVTWPGELDLAPDAMYREIKASGEWVLN